MLKQVCCVVGLFVEISITDIYSLRVNQERRPHGSWMYRSASTWIGINDIRLTLVTVFNWAVVHPICHPLGLGCTACRATLRQVAVQLVFLNCFSQIIGQLYFDYFGLRETSFSLFSEFRNFQQLLFLVTLLLKLKLLLLFLKFLKWMLIKTFFSLVKVLFLLKLSEFYLFFSFSKVYCSLMVSLKFFSAMFCNKYFL